MSRSNYNIFVILIISLFAIAYLFFLDIKDMAYVSSPSVIKSRDVQVELELKGTKHQLFGRFRNEVSSPYKANLYFVSDIPMTNIFIRDFTIKSNMTGKVYSYHNDPTSPIQIQFEELEVGVEAYYLFNDQQPIEFHEKEMLIASLSFETEISGLRETHNVQFNLIPKIKRTRKLLLPEEARKKLDNY